MIKGKEWRKKGNAVKRTVVPNEMHALAVCRKGMSCQVVPEPSFGKVWYTTGQLLQNKNITREKKKLPGKCFRAGEERHKPLTAPYPAFNPGRRNFKRTPKAMAQQYKQASEKKKV